MAFLNDDDYESKDEDNGEECDDDSSGDEISRELLPPCLCHAHDNVG